MIPASPDSMLTAAEFEQVAQDIRPALHRYVARMVGSTIDAEDVVQEALVKAYDSLALLSARSNVRGWLFRIAHNKAIDQLRRNSYQPVELLDEYPMDAEPDQPLEDKELATLALSVFLKLAPRQRSCVILKDVMGYSLAEISELLNATVPEIKATLHRGRSRLRELGKSAEVGTPTLDRHEQFLLAQYVDRFNARDFDGLRLMLADEARLDLVARKKLVSAAEIQNRYFNQYDQVSDWHLSVGFVEGRPAILVDDPLTPATEPAYFILIKWEGIQVTHIRDYRYARYVMTDIATTWNQNPPPHPYSGEAGDR